MSSIVHFGQDTFFKLPGAILLFGTRAMPQQPCISEMDSVAVTGLPNRQESVSMTLLCASILRRSAILSV